MNLNDIGKALSMLWKKLTGCFDKDPQLPFLIITQFFKVAFMALLLTQSELIAMMNINQPYMTLLRLADVLLIPLGIAVIIFGLFDRLMAYILKLPILKKRWRFSNQGSCLVAINCQALIQGEIGYLFLVLPLIISGFILDYRNLKAQEDQENRKKHLSMLK